MLIFATIFENDFYNDFLVLIFVCTIFECRFCYDFLVLIFSNDFSVDIVKTAVFGTG